MNAMTKPHLLLAAALVALLLVAGPALAVEDDPEEGVVEAPADDEGRIVLVEDGRDAFFLLMLGALLTMGGFGLMNARRQLKGERPQASGEFRWR